MERGRGEFPASPGASPGASAGHLGRVTGASRQRGEAVPARGSTGAGVAGATAVVRAGPEPERGRVEAVEVHGVGERMLREPRGVAPRLSACAGAVAAQARSGAGMLWSGRTRLESSAEVSSSYMTCS